MYRHLFSMKVFSFLFSMFSLFATSVFGQKSFTSGNGQIYAPSGERFHVHGVSWFGLETEISIFHGLWAHDIPYYVDILQQLDVNVVRIPFSAEWILHHRDAYPDVRNVWACGSCRNKTSLEILDIVIDKLAEADIKVMLDLHRLHKEFISPLWYSADGTYTEDTFFETWYYMLDRYGNKPNFFAIDLLNEPHDSATWGDGNVNTDWCAFASSAISQIESKYIDNPRWLYFVEGIGWGQWLGSALDHPVILPPSASNRLVYSPHTYGRSVTPDLTTDGKSLVAIWDDAFGSLRKAGHTICVGEWGGRMDIDSQWMNELVDYLIEINATDNFFWALNPDSGDVMGLLRDDWTTIDKEKIAIVQRLSVHKRKHLRGQR